MELELTGIEFSGLSPMKKMIDGCDCLQNEQCSKLACAHVANAESLLTNSSDGFLCQ